MRDLTDNWFFENGYWTINQDVNNRYSYVIVEVTEKWRELIDTCLRKNGLNKIITQDVLIKTIEKGELKRNPQIMKTKYVKKVRPEGYKTVKERQEEKRKKKELKKLKELKNANRNTE